MALDPGGGTKRRRSEEQEGRRDGLVLVAEAIPEDRISMLPDELRERILTHLPLKEAIRSGVWARGWRDLWKSRWTHRSSVEIHLSSRAALRRELDALAREPWPRRRLDRFSLIVDIWKFRSAEIRRFLNYTAECCVEDLHVETRKSTVAAKLNFHLPLASPLLARLSLLRINMSGLFYKGAQPFHALEVILLHSVYVSQDTVRKMMALCPSLLTLDIRYCDCANFFYSDQHKRLVFPPKLRSVTIVECKGLAILNLVAVPSLRSFRYSGRERSFSLPKDTALEDLYICLDGPTSSSWDICMFNDSLPNDLSGLTALTICSNVLTIASSSWSMTQNPKLSNLQSLRELQLLIRKMDSDNLANIYMFLKTCQCTILERLFVQLPTSDCVSMAASLHELGEEPPEVALHNLKIARIMNFNWRSIEVRLVSFLLRKASFLHKLLLVSPNVAPLSMPGVQEAGLLLIKEALSNGKIVISESDDAATQPYHSEIFIEI